MVSREVGLQVQGLHLAFGGLQALAEVDVEVRKGEICAIIGPNGAGKTSLLNCVNGFYRPQKGDIFFDGKTITRLPSHKIAALGISRTFQNIQLYTGLTTLDNLMAARHIHLKPNFLAGAIYFGWEHGKEIQHRRVVEETIDFLEMEPIRKKVVGIRKDLPRPVKLGTICKINYTTYKREARDGNSRVYDLD